MRITVIVCLGALLLLFGGCSLSLYSYRDQAWRKDAEAVCLAKGGYSPSPYIERLKRLNDTGACGIHYPLKVSRALQGYVALSEPAILNCPTTGAFDGWLYHVVQPAAQRIYGAYVTDIRTMGSYNCRTRNSQRGAKASEHAFGNAIDVAAFTLTDGRTVTILNGWRGDPQDQVFLREVHKGACSVFTTVIGPDGDRHHRDHLHMDLARHDAEGKYRYCR